MFKRPVLYEILLLLVSALLGWRLIGMWYPRAPEIADHGAAAPEGQARTSAPIARTGGLERDKGKRPLFEVIANKNLFSPERREAGKEASVEPGPPEPAPPPKPPPPALRPEPQEKPQAPRPPKKRNTLVIEGIFIFGEYRTAMVRDLSRPRDGASRVRAGDRMKGYVVEKIAGKELVLRGAEGEVNVLRLFSADLPVKRRHVKTPVVTSRSREARPVKKGLRPVKGTGK